MRRNVYPRYNPSTCEWYFRGKWYSTFPMAELDKYFAEEQERAERRSEERKWNKLIKQAKSLGGKEKGDE